MLFCFLLDIRMAKTNALIDAIALTMSIIANPLTGEEYN